MIRHPVFAGAAGALLARAGGDHRWAGDHVGRPAIERFLPRDEDGTVVYANRTVLVVRTRFGRMVEHEVFYEDTGRILDFAANLRARGIAPA